MKANNDFFCVLIAICIVFMINKVFKLLSLRQNQNGEKNSLQCIKTGNIFKNYTRYRSILSRELIYKRMFDSKTLPNRTYFLTTSTWSDSQGWTSYLPSLYSMHCHHYIACKISPVQCRYRKAKIKKVRSFRSQWKTRAINEFEAPYQTFSSLLYETGLIYAVLHGVHSKMPNEKWKMFLLRNQITKISAGKSNK